jgi:uncharacterized protein YeaO (DUF488 family)
MSVDIKRVYEKPEKSDGYRILVDRVWPRGMTKEKAAIDLWLKEIAPSTALRKWFGHDPEKWEAFSTRYTAELKANKEVLSGLIQRVKDKKTTLIYSAKDEDHNQAVVIQHLLSSL